MQGIGGANSGEIVSDRGFQLDPVLAAIRGAQNRSGGADDPANLCGGSGAGDEIRGYAALLRGPLEAAIGGMLERTVRAKAPELLSARGEENVRVLQSGVAHHCFGARGSERLSGYFDGLSCRRECIRIGGLFFGCSDIGGRRRRRCFFRKGSRHRTFRKETGFGSWR